MNGQTISGNHQEIVIAGLEKHFDDVKAVNGLSIIYILPIPMVIYVAYPMRGIQVGSLFKVGMASLVIVPLCFSVAALVSRIPGVGRVL